MSASCLIIGAGISGLTTACQLRRHGFSVTLLDKGRGVGGRMATRRWDNAQLDHGAQYFSARDPRFQAETHQWLRLGLVREWFTVDGEPRYFAPRGMSSIPKHLAASLDIHTATRVTALRPHSAGWLVTTDTGAEWQASAVVLTAPVPQSLALCSAFQHELPPAALITLHSLRYDPCLALLVRLHASSAIPAPGCLRLSSDVLAWAADNSQKGISPPAPGAALTLHATPAFSATHWDSPQDDVASAMLAAAQPFLGSSVAAWQLHRWRFAQPNPALNSGCLRVDAPAPLVFSGDAFSAPRIEGAYLSGLAAAHALLAA